MPYVFSKTAQAMGQGDDKADIFSQGGNQQGGGSKPKGFGLTGGGGESVGAPPVSDAGGKAPSLGLTSGQSAQQMAGMNQPVGNAGANVFGDVGAAIKQSQQALQKESDTFSQSGEKEIGGRKNYSQEDIDKMVQSGDTGELFSALNTPFKSGIKDFKSGVSTAGIQVPKTQEDIASTLQRKSGPNYTKGMSRLDAALLSKSQPFQQTMETLQSDKGQIEAQREAAEKSLTGTEVDQSERAYKTRQDQIRASLEALRAGALEREASSVNEMSERARSSPTAYDPEYGKAWEAALEQAKKEGLNIDVNKVGGSRGDFDPAQFYTRSQTGDLSSPTSYFDEGERRYYNNIQSLLGGDPLAEQTAPGFSDTYDIGALSKAIRSKYEMPVPGIGDSPETAAYSGPRIDADGMPDYNYPEHEKAADSESIEQAVGRGNPLGHFDKTREMLTNAAMAPVNAVKGVENTRKKIAKMF